MCVTYVSDAYIKRLNLKYKKINKATDVLAFSALEGRSIKGIGSFLGDIIISVDTAKRQANIFNSTKTKELELYLVHGILHLLGYRDDTKKNFECMTRTQEGLLRKI